MVRRDGVGVVSSRAQAKGWLLLMAMSMALGASATLPPQLTWNGVCDGRVQLNSSWGIFGDHVGHGNYTRGITCEWLISPFTNNTEPFEVYLQIHSNSIFGGRLFVWEGSDTTTSPAYFYWGMDPQYFSSAPLEDTESFYAYFDYHPYSFARYLENDYFYVGGRNLLHIRGSSEVVLRLVTSSVTDFDPDIIGFEQLLGFTMTYWTPEGLPLMLCEGQKDLVLDGRGFITDGWGALTQVGVNWSERTCSWILTSEVPYYLSIKSFQPKISQTELKIVLADRTYILNGASKPDETEAEGQFRVIEDVFVWDEHYILIGPYSPVLVEYNVPEFNFVNSSYLNLMNSSGFVMEYWPQDISYCTEAEIVDLSDDNDCLWLYASSGIGTIPPTLSCHWEISNSITEELVIWIKDLDFGTFSGDSLIISAALDDGPYQEIVSPDVHDLPPLIRLPAQLSPKNIELEYSVTFGGGRGFTLLISPLSNFPTCLGANLISNSSSSGTEDISLTPAQPTDTDIYYFYSGDPKTTRISTQNDLFDVALWGINRCLVYSNRGYSWDYYTDMPDSDVVVLLIRIRTFSLQLPPISISFDYFQPSYYHTTQTFINPRWIVTPRESSFSIVKITYNGNNIMRLDESGFLSYFQWITDSNLFDQLNSIRSMAISSLNNQTILLISYVNNELPKSPYNLRRFEVMGNGLVVENNSPIVDDRLASFVGNVMSLSPSSYWLSTYHSPQTYKISLFFINKYVYEANPAYTDWSFPDLDRKLFTSSKITDDLFMAGTCFLTNFEAGITIGVLCETDYELCNYNPPTSNLSAYFPHTNWRYLDFSFPGSLCKSSTQTAIDFFRLPSGSLVIALGDSDSTSVYLIFIDEQDTLQPKIPFPRENIDLSINITENSRFLILTNSEDNLFGSNLLFSPDTLEVSIIGKRAYIFGLLEAYSVSTYFNETNTISIFTLATLSFVPNRFTYQLDDWSEQSPQSSLSASHMFFLINSYPQSTRDMNEESTRVIPLTEAGHQIVSMVDLPYSLHSVPCPVGSFKNYTGYGSCILCPIGTYQDTTGSTTCKICKETSYCPLGSNIEIQDGSTDVLVTIPLFNTYLADGLDSIIWPAVFLEEMWLYIPLYIVWGLSILIFVFILLTSSSKKSCLRSTSYFFTNCFNLIDGDPIIYWSPFSKKWEEKYSLKKALANLLLWTFIIFVTIYCVWYFYQYQQYTGQEDILNNMRTSSLKPYFTASSDELILLNYMRSLGLQLSIEITGYSRTQCKDICTDTSNFQSTGCFLKSTSQFCSDFSNGNSPHLNCTSREDICFVAWNLPSKVDLLLDSSYTFKLKDLIAQEFKVSLRIAGEEKPNLEGVDLSLNTARISESFTTDVVQLSRDDLILFGINRRYELTYVLQSSEQVSANGIDWNLQSVFFPLQNKAVVETTTVNNYLSTLQPNSITIQINQPNYFVGNVEYRMYESGQMFLTIVNIILGASGILEFFFGILIRIRLSFLYIKDVCCPTKKEEVFPLSEDVLKKAEIRKILKQLLVEEGIINGASGSASASGEIEII